MMTLGSLQLPLLARRHALDVIHDPSGVCPFVVGGWARGHKRVASLYDATAFLYPETHAVLTRLHDVLYVRAALPHVDAVITSSTASRQDLIRFMHIPESKIHVVPLAADLRFRPVARESASEVAARYGLHEPFILYFGALEPRKNIPALLQAFAELRIKFPGLTLALGGGARWKYAEIPRTITRLNLTSAVQFTGYVADADLPALYSAASVFCYPSLYEGFGLPVLEALACGAPVVAANVSSLPEVAGEAAVLVEPNAEGISAGIRSILRNADLAADLRQRGPVHAAKYSWARTATLTLDVYDRLLGRL
jgi:glycosyltransferase involved in cell wall biosynthesis